MILVHSDHTSIGYSRTLGSRLAPCMQLIQTRAKWRYLKASARTSHTLSTWKAAAESTSSGYSCGVSSLVEKVIFLYIFFNIFFFFQCFLTFFLDIVFNYFSQILVFKNINFHIFFSTYFFNTFFWLNRKTVTNYCM